MSQQELNNLMQEYYQETGDSQPLLRTGTLQNTINELRRRIANERVANRQRDEQSLAELISYAGAIQNQGQNVPPEMRQLKNNTLYPHIGSATHETRTKMGMLAVENLIAFFNQKQVTNQL